MATPTQIIPQKNIGTIFFKDVGSEVQKKLGKELREIKKETRIVPFFKQASTHDVSLKLQGHKSTNFEAVIPSQAVDTTDPAVNTTEFSLKNLRITLENERMILQLIRYLTETELYLLFLLTDKKNTITEKEKNDFVKTIKERLVTYRNPINQNLYKKFDTFLTEYETVLKYLQENKIWPKTESPPIPAQRITARSNIEEEDRPSKIYQIKDAYQKLHKDETLLAEQKKFKNDPRFEDVILQQNANDPYYHKNQFNLSQTYHYTDYIFHPSPPPAIQRPEISEEYVNENPGGAKVFYPSFLRGEYIDIETKPRVFEELLLRTKYQPPTEMEIINNLMKECADDEASIANMRVDISFRLDELGEEESLYPLSFKNYYRNLCHWLITGNLKEDMNENVLTDIRGTLFKESVDGRTPYRFQSIEHLEDIHNKIEDLHEATMNIDTMMTLAKSLTIEIASTKANEVYERQKKQAAEFEQEEKLKKMEKELKEKQTEARLAKDRKIMEIKKRVTIIKESISIGADTFKNTVILQIKATNFEIGGESVSMSSLEAEINKYKAEFLTTLENNYPSIVSLRDKIYLFYQQFNPLIEKYRGQVARIFSDADNLKLAGEFDTTDRENEAKIQNFKEQLDDLSYNLTQMRMKLSTYQIILDWYEQTKPRFGGTSAVNLAGDFSNGSIYIDGLTKYYIKLTYITYDADGNTENEYNLSNFILDDKTKEVYFFSIKDDDGNPKDVILSATPIRRFGDRHVNLNISVVDKTTP